MTVSIQHEMTVFWTFVLCGQILGAFFDFFRALRKKFPHNKAIVATEDIIFCTAAFKVFFDICYVTNNGGLRWYIFASFICSSIIYFCLVSKYIIVMWNFLINLLLKLLVPFKKLICFFSRIIKFIFSGLKKRINTLFLLVSRVFSRFKFKKRPKSTKNKDFLQFFCKKTFTFLKK